VATLEPITSEARNVVVPASLLLRLEVEELLFREAALLDAWQLDEWLDLLTDDVTYVVPTNDLPDGVAHRDVLFINDDRPRVEARVERLKSRHAHREYPSSRTRRLITNVRVAEHEGGDVEAWASFAVYRNRAGETGAYVGSYYFRLRRSADGLRIAHRRATLDLERLHDHGAVSIIL
jgi:p-cumate 2,3-dioxygenase beta subunit